MIAVGPLLSYCNWLTISRSSRQRSGAASIDYRASRAIKWFGHPLYLYDGHCPATPIFPGHRQKRRLAQKWLVMPRVADWGRGCVVQPSPLVYLKHFRTSLSACPRLPSLVLFPHLISLTLLFASSLHPQYSSLFRSSTCLLPLALTKHGLILYGLSLILCLPPVSHFSTLIS